MTLHKYRVGRSCPSRSRNLYKSRVKIQLLIRIWLPKPGQTALGTRFNRVPDVQVFQKPYLPHPDSYLDVLYMNLDLLDELYPMVKSKLPFEEFDQGGQTA